MVLEVPGGKSAPDYGTLRMPNGVDINIPRKGQF